MSTASTNQFQKGMFIKFKEEPHQIVEFQHVNPGKGSAFVRTRVKSLKTGRVQEFTYKSGETVEQLDIFTKEMQFLYKSVDEYQFMDNKNYEQLAISNSVLGNLAGFLKEGDTYQVLVFDSVAIGVRFPKKVRLKVSETEDAAKGNTVSGAVKSATLETGAVVSVPLFIKEGDMVAVDPESGQYLERVTI